jgi:hypothetical protein
VSARAWPAEVNELLDLGLLSPAPAQVDRMAVEHRVFRAFERDPQLDALLFGICALNAPASIARAVCQREGCDYNTVGFCRRCGLTPEPEVPLD